jgi:integrator complex subunit 11
LQLDVRLSVQYMSFSAHADAKGIMQLVSQCSPANVLLVHGEADKMKFLQDKVSKEFGEQSEMFINWRDRDSD